MRTALLLIAAIATITAAEDTWTKVKDLKSGSELRITREGAKQPLMAQMDHATDETLYIATKKEQLSIPKSEIVRLDARPPQTGSRLTRQATTKSNEIGNPSPSEQRPGGRLAGPSSSASSSLSIGSKPDFETIYRRMPGAPPLK
jgi:hypothetical protein